MLAPLGVGVAPVGVEGQARVEERRLDQRDRLRQRHRRRRRGEQHREMFADDVRVGGQVPLRRETHLMVHDPHPQAPQHVVPVERRGEELIEIVTLSRLEARHLRIARQQAGGVRKGAQPDVELVEEGLTNPGRARRGLAQHGAVGLREVDGGEAHGNRVWREGERGGDVGGSAHEASYPRPSPHAQVFHA